MSIKQRLWLALLGFFFLALLSNLAINTLTTRQYLEEQLATHSQDSATSLALSMTQQAKDTVTLDLLVASQFDSGQYALIRLTDTTGKVISERQSNTNIQGVPDWFEKLIRIRTTQAQAKVSQGWNNFGEVTVIVSNQAAYLALWKTGQQNALALLGMGLVAALLTALLIRQVSVPLQQVVQQAEAISRRQFDPIPLPNAIELRRVVKSLNQMAVQLQSLFAEEASRLESMKAALNNDPLTQVANREHFMARLEAERQGENRSEGALFLIRINDLAGHNRRLGRDATDTLVQDTARLLRDLIKPQSDWLIGRLNGADFAIFAPDCQAATAAAQSLLESIQPLASRHDIMQLPLYSLGGAEFDAEATLGSILSQADRALIMAEAAGLEAPVLLSETDLRYNNQRWQQELSRGLAEHHFFFDHYPLINAREVLLREEQMLRLRDSSGRIHAAGAFMPMASRLGQLATLDLEVIRLAVNQLAQDDDSTIAITLSGETTLNPDFADHIHASLQQHKVNGKRLAIEVAESSISRDPDSFAHFIRRLKPQGCLVGLKHVGRRSSQLARLHTLNLDYIKVDAGLIRRIDQNPGGQSFLEALLALVHKLDGQVFAEGVESPEEAKTLWTLGFDGITGPQASRLQEEKQSKSAG